MATLTPIQAATQLLLHLDGNLLDTGARKTKGLVSSAGGPGSMSAGASKFGTQAYDLAAPSTATGMSWQGLCIPPWTAPHMYEGFFYLRSYGDWYLFRVDPTAADCYVSPTGYLNVRVFGQSGGSPRLMQSRAPVPTNAWIHIRVVIIPNRLDSTRPIRMFFLDGVLQATSFDSDTPYPVTNNGWMSLGHRLNSNLSSFDGRANEFMMLSGMVLNDVSQVDPPTAVLPDTAGTDPQYANTLLLLHCDGSNGGTTFTDSSSYARIPTAVNGTVTTSTSDKVFGTASLALASAGWLEYTNSNLNLLLTDDFEVEMRVKCTAIGSGNLFFTLQSSGSNMVGLRFSSGPVMEFYRNASGSGSIPGGVVTTSLGSVSLGTWYHVRMVRIGNDFLIWIDGELRACAQVALEAGSASVFIGGTGFAGNIDEFRLTKALRTPVNFTPPTAKYADVPTADCKLVSTPRSLINGLSKAGAPNFKTVTPALFMKDANYGGRGRISGTVKVKSAPSYAVKREVRLIRDKDGACIRSTWSDPTTGAYEFRYVDETQRYTILTYDYTHDKRAVVADNIQPELM